MDTRLRVMIRRAEPRDYQGVLNILPNLFDGADYMFHKYHGYMEDPCAHPMVAVLDNKVIGFSNCEVINNGTACVMTGRRILPQLAYKGIITMAGKAAQEAALKRFPNITKSFFSAVDSKHYERYRKNNSLKTIVYDRHFLHYRTKTEVMKNLFNYLCQRKGFSSRPPSKIITATAAETLLFKDSHLEQFFPEKHFMYGVQWMPLEVNKDNIIRAAMDKHTSVATTVSIDKHCSGISFGSYMQTPLGPSFIHFFHVEDIDSMMDQLMCHLDVNRELYAKSSSCVIDLIFPKVIDKYEIKRELFQFLGENTICEHTPTEGAIIIENHLKLSML